MPVCEYNSRQKAFSEKDGHFWQSLNGSFRYSEVGDEEEEDYFYVRIATQVIDFCALWQLPTH